MAVVIAKVEAAVVAVAAVVAPTLAELNYLCPLLPVEHRPSTTPRHCTLFWAALAFSVQLAPCCFSSASVSLQLLRGRPRFVFPCGFQVRALHLVLDAGFLWVFPIQPHLLGHWFLSHSLPQIFISDLLLPTLAEGA